MARKQVDENDAALWQKVAETVTPLPRRSCVKSASPEKPQTKLHQKASKKRQQKTGPARRQIDQVAAVATSAARLQPADLNTIGYGGISRSNARMIRTGQARPTARIDLHGSTRDEAKSKLERFVIAAAGEGHRVILVITGKGVQGQGVIRRNLPYWLSSPPLAELVIAYCEAQPKDGGSGAYYVNLRQL